MSDDTTEGWDSIEPGLAIYYALDIDDAVTMAKERCAEWDYHDDPHGYCHERPVLQMLIRAVERVS